MVQAAGERAAGGRRQGSAREGGIRTRNPRLAGANRGFRAASRTDRLVDYFFLSTNHGMTWSKVTVLPIPVATMKLMP